MTTLDERTPEDPADDVALLAHSATEVAVARARRTGRRRGRRPVRRALVLIHRWPSLVLGLLLVLETTSGAVLLYDAEYFRVTHSNLYQASSGGDIGAEEAIQVVAAAEPDFTPIWAGRDDGVWMVGNADYRTVYAVDPGSGRINGHTDTDGGVMGFLVNLHDCALTCEGYPGYVSWLGADVPTLGTTFLTGITWAAVVLGVLGLLMILLAVTGVVTWWPGRGKWRHGFRVRTGKGRFARDYDLHNVFGIVAVPFILMWGITGAAFEFPVVEKAWLALTGGEQTTEPDFAVTPDPATADRPDIGTDTAVSTALARVPGTAQWIGLPSEDADWYEIDVVTGYASSRGRAIYSGDAYVLVDAHNASNIVVFDDGEGALSNRFYDKYLEPTHFGWNVNAWWRIVWFVLGMAPLGLMITGVSTWLFRRGTRKRQQAAKAARAAAAA